MDRIERIPAQHIRACAVRRVKTWNQAEAKRRLHLGKAEGRFRLLDSGGWPAEETWFDVAFNGQRLFLSVMCLESGEARIQLTQSESDAEGVEVLFDPFGDRVGYLQFIAGARGGRGESSHWPYRDARLNRLRDVVWEVTAEDEPQPGDQARFFFFRFDLAEMAGRDWIGFNVGRTQGRLAENSSWNLSSGMGFPDPGGFGRLWLRRPPVFVSGAAAEVRGDSLVAVRFTGVAARDGARFGARLIDPGGTTVAQWRPRAMKDAARLPLARPLALRIGGRYRLVLEGATQGVQPCEPEEFFFDHPGRWRRAFHLQGTYDWPDNFMWGTYSPRDLQREMKWYGECGLKRVYWIDYKAESWTRRWKGWNTPALAPCLQRVRRAERLFGEDFLFGAARAARKAGIEFFTVFKPFDFLWDEPFILKHPHCCIRRDPSTESVMSPAVGAIRLYQSDERPLPFKPGQVKLWESRDNKRYTPVRGRFAAGECVVDRPESVWSPLGLQGTDRTRCARCLALSGINVQAPYLAVTVEKCDPARSLRNRPSASTTSSITERVRVDSMPVRSRTGYGRAHIRHTGIFPASCRNRGPLGFCRSTSTAICRSPTPPAAHSTPTRPAIRAPKSGL